MSITIGIIGAAGKRGYELFNLFSSFESDVLVTALADVSVEKLQEKYQRLHTVPEFFTNEEEFFQSKDFEVAIVATPDAQHAEHVCKALNYGKHVYLEKPMATTPDACDRIIETARKSKKFLYVGHNLRHFTVIQKIKEIIAAGGIGEVKAVSCLHHVSYGRQNYFNRWHQDRENVGGLLIHKASHDLDIIHWFASSHTEEVVAMGNLLVWQDQPGKPSVEDISSVLMRLENGVQASYSQCHFSYLACREYTVFGTHGTLRNQDDNPKRAVVQLFGNRRRDAQNIPTEEWRFSEESGFHGKADQRIITEFIRILKGEQQPTISLLDAAWAVKTGYAATVSLRNGSLPMKVS